MNPQFIFNGDNKIEIDGKEYRLCYLDPYKETIGIMIDGERVETVGGGKLDFKTVCNILKQFKETNEVVLEALFEKLKLTSEQKEIIKEFGI